MTPKIREGNSQMCLWILTESGWKRGTWVLGVMVLWHAQEQILWHLMSSSGIVTRLQLLQAALAKLELIWKMRECPLMQKLVSVCSHYSWPGRLIRGDYWFPKWNTDSFSKRDTSMMIHLWKERPSLTMALESCTRFWVVCQATSESMSPPSFTWLTVRKMPGQQIWANINISGLDNYSGN